MFPGQGSQYPGMGKKLFDRYDTAKEVYKEADRVLEFELSSLCFEGSNEQLQQTALTQPAILTQSVAAYRVFLQQFDIRPHFMAGHSLGEITALTCSGSISFADAVRLVNKRGIFMQEAMSTLSGGMSAISGVSFQVVDQVCTEVSSGTDIVSISNNNMPNQTVISGTLSVLELAESRLQLLGASIYRLKVSAPFHSVFMKDAARKLEQELRQIRLAELEIPVISNVRAMPYSGKSEIVELLTTQMTSPVQWNATMDFLVRQGVNFTLELGPQRILRNMMRKTYAGLDSHSFDNDIAALKELF